ncbi:hypothetical protein [Bradyrhizobium ivorense]|uniref:hypothetical protein n=1 Tax=Bradyrhizobium ivorense TaxID=2511166 RepID=UPI0011209AD4|nr:hypothetical protein [Bradyrhizobium ivorense]
MAISDVLCVKYDVFHAKCGARSSNGASKDFPCHATRAEKSEHSGTSDNWKTALFLSVENRGTVCGV